MKKHYLVLLGVFLIVYSGIVTIILHEYLTTDVIGVKRLKSLE